MNNYQVIRRPLVTEKGHDYKDNLRTLDGKLRRRGRFAGYRPEWKKAYVKLKTGQKVPDFAEI
jgi:large subunit ribosomal protein L23